MYFDQCGKIFGLSACVIALFIVSIYCECEKYLSVHFLKPIALPLVIQTK